jgi:prepilin-type processing-associated H-X9-DG protein
MSKNQNNNKNKKNITVAQIAFVSAVIAILCMCPLCTSSVELAVGSWTLFSGAAIFSVAAIVLGLVSLSGRRKQRNIIDKALAIFSIVVPAIMIIFVFLLPRLTVDHEPAPRIVCGTNLKGLGVCIMRIYFQEYKKYPTPDKWCELLIELDFTTKKQFLCIDARRRGDRGPCHYAINPNANPASDPNVVLVFETKGGWNQYGGPELLNFENHKGKGCNVLFNDGSVRFIIPKDVNGLNWGDEQKQ